ncbi:MAG: hypothetical protein M1830_000113 [Pleopsidium flavum]|nr:MAG: hypothetical protein M1830_000113 [Pleopsidium flavum]
MAPNFAACGILFENNLEDLYANYSYSGPVSGVLRTGDRPALITLAGCELLCGVGNEYYPWKEASNTITTWILPVIGMLLQAPFESNKFRKTMFALCRWVGSPIVSLSYILWNIKVTGKCALLVDMATRYEEVPDEESEFSQMRDSFYILSVMNQYAIKARMPGVEAEKLLRIALFSDSLKLVPSEDETRSLVKRRRKLAKSLREGRKRGIVPVFISLMWFLFSLGLSIQTAFGQLGENATAHDLALGLLLGWLPVLLLSGIVDRNPVATDDIRLKLNRLLDAIRLALLNPDLRITYMRDTGRTPQDFAWTMHLSNEDYFREDFFTAFAGQGRVRWHYGVAHPILAGIENSFVAEYGRDWLRDAEEARNKLVLGPKTISGLRWFDPREIWQMISAIAVVTGTAGGAFILSYWTPTVGLGCRSGGYMIFVVNGLVLLTVELLVWWLVPESSMSSDWLRHYAPEDTLTRIGSNIEHRLHLAESNKWTLTARKVVHRMISFWLQLTPRDRIEVLLLRPVEVINSVWLCYIISAQTFGSYRNCRCMASVWGGHGGYIDFESAFWYRSHGVLHFWSSGTSLSCAVMAISFAYIVFEWCTQSHLSTEDYGKASRGLRRTRTFKKCTAWLRDAPKAIIEVIKVLRFKMLGGKVKYGRRSVVWKSYTKQYHGLPQVIQGWGIPGAEEDHDLLPGRKDSANSTVMQTLRPPSEAHSKSSARGSSDVTEGIPVRYFSTP